MTTTGNTDYKKIQDRQYLNIETENAQKIVSELNKQNILYSARYDEAKISLTFSKSDFDKVNEIIGSLQPTVPEESVQNAADKALEEIKRQLRELQERQKLSEDLVEEQKKEQEKEQEQVKNTSAETADTLTEPGQQEQENKTIETVVDKKKESLNLLPIISSNVFKQEQKIEDLTARRDLAEEKISRHQERIASLTAKAERLSTTNQMLTELINNRSTPNAVKNSLRAVIKVNEKKIAKIRNKKIPKREGKIEKQQSKIERLDKRINLARCKINRYKSFNQVVTSFSLFNNTDRRKQFSVAMDELHNNSLALLNAKIDVRTDNIMKLTKLYKESPALAISLKVPESLSIQKIKRQRLINKRNKLMGVIIPYVSQPENVQEEALKRSEAVVDNAIKQEDVSAADAADKVAVAPLPALPEHSIVEPEPTQDKTLLPEIATVMDISVSELESKPKDIKQMLILDYTNKFESTPEKIKESLSAIIAPTEAPKKEERTDNRTDDNTVFKKYGLKDFVKENPLKNAEELIEGNYNRIDGIINNEPPKKEEHKEKKVFTFSRKQLNENAQKIRDKEDSSKEKSRDINKEKQSL